MEHTQLLATLGYIWPAFGACWIGFGFAHGRRTDAASTDPANDRRRLRVAVLAISFVLLFEGRHSIPPAAMIIFGVVWGAIGLYWVTPTKAVQSGEFPFYRVLRLVALATIFALLFWDHTAIGILGRRFFPVYPALEVTGFIVALCGIALALWARIHLGNYWSDKVEVKVDHQLIRSGPYAFLRHPIYSGVLLGVAGTAVLLGQWRGVLAFAILLANYVIKARREDRILAGAFAEFPEHKKHAGFLLPNFRRRV